MQPLTVGYRRSLPRPLNARTLPLVRQDITRSLVAGACNHLNLRFSAAAYDLLTKLAASPEIGLFRAAA